MEKNLYERLKPYHVQQITRTGCSLVSFLMVLNAIKGFETNQDSFYKVLKHANRDWFNRTSDHGKGLYVKRFYRYINQMFNLCNVDASISMIKARDFKRDYEGFCKFCKEVYESNNSYIIFNFDSHYSPLGRYHEINDNKFLTILDVDYSEKYGKEFRYDNYYGELEFSAWAFYRKLVNQNRYFLMITINECFSELKKSLTKE